MKSKKAKALVMFSGGLDSILAVKLLEEQGVRVEGITITTPFSNPETPIKNAERIGLELHIVKVGKGYFDIIRKPKHGYGANMNPCLDCKVYFFKRAKALAKKVKADFIATGEVLGERPFSQRKNQLELIEKNAGLRGKVLRPLSAKLLPPTEAEMNGLVDRKRLMAIQGRTRRQQMELARKFNIRKYPSPGGGCLLTDKPFSSKLRDFLEYNKTLTWRDVEFLKLGRHFRYKKEKIIVGRNEKENISLMALAKGQKLAWMEVKDYPGPVSVLQGKSGDIVKKAAGLTVLYSDAPYKEVELTYVKGRKEKTLNSRSVKKKELEQMRIV